MTQSLYSAESVPSPNRSFAVLGEQPNLGDTVVVVDLCSTEGMPPVEQSVLDRRAVGAVGKALGILLGTGDIWRVQHEDAEAVYCIDEIAPITELTPVESVL